MTPYTERARELANRFWWDSCNAQKLPTKEEFREAIAAALAEVRAEAIEECASRVKSLIGKQWHDNDDLLDYAEGLIRALLPTQELCGARKVTEGEL